MNDELVGTMDQSIDLTPGDLAVFTQVDELIDRSIISGDLSRPMQFGRGLKRSAQATGLALAKLLSRIQDHWPQYQAAGIDDEFVDVMQSELGLSPQTVLKYSSMWKAIFDNGEVAEDTKQRLLGKPIKSLLLLTAGAREGSLDLDKIAECVTPHEIHQLVKESRGEQTSSGSRVLIAINVRTGELLAKLGDGVWENFGLINLESQNNSPAIAKAVERILKSAGVMQI